MQPIIDVYVPADKKEVARAALKLVMAKVPMPTRVIEQ